MNNLENGTDLIVFSSNSFGSCEVRTSELMVQFAHKKRVYFIESPIIGVANEATYFLRKDDHRVTVIQPHIPGNTSVFEQKEALLELVKELIHEENMIHYTIWTDTPTSMYVVKRLSSEINIYDCIKNYSETHTELEKELFQYADVVLTSGYSNHYHDALIANEERKQA